MIELKPLHPSDREQFILDNQEAFNYGALEEFGRRDDHFEEDGEIISRETIEASIDDGEAYRIIQDGQPVGGVVIKVEGERGNLELLFVSPKVHSKGIGYAAWCAVEKLHPEVKIWETVTPYFEKRNTSALKWRSRRSFAPILRRTISASGNAARLRRRITRRHYDPFQFIRTKAHPAHG